MYLSPHNKHVDGIHFGQGGFLLPMAVFILVGMAALALAIIGLSADSGSASYYEAFSAQAFYAAESAAQVGMHSLFFPDDTRTVVDANCDALSQTINFSVNGLKNCSANISCSRSVDAAGLTSYYQISSVANCASGDLMAQRTIELSTFAK